MSELTRHPLPGLSGGCQCGAIRFEVAPCEGLVNLCFCSMCVAATGSPVPSFVSVPQDAVSWHGSPAVYRSSEIATRGYCPECGTPLFYRGNTAATIGIAAGAIQTPLAPDVVFYAEQAPAWLKGVHDLPAPDFGTDP